MDDLMGEKTFSENNLIINALWWPYLKVIHLANWYNFDYSKTSST